MNSIKLASLILHLPRSVKRLIVLLVDALLCVLSVYLAFYLRLGVWPPLFCDSQSNLLLAVIASITLSLPIFFIFGLYREIFRYSGWFALFALLKAIGLYGLAFVITFSFIGISDVPRTIGVIQPIILGILVAAIRAVASYLLSNAYRKQLKLTNKSKVLIYGAGDAGRQLAAALSHSEEIRVVGFLDDDPSLQGSSLAGKNIYDPNHLNDLVVNLNASKVLLAIPSASRFRRNQIIELVHAAKIAIQTLPSMSELAFGSITIQALRPLDIDDLLGRELVLPDSDLLMRNSNQKIIMITGAGGSIGSELCRQILECSPKALVLVEQNEYALYKIHQELITRANNFGKSDIQIIPLFSSITNADRMRAILSEYMPHIIYHAAAYKHVPLVEANVIEGVRNNVIGTMTVAQLSIELGVSNFILISTDKAVRPTSVMGASKRLAEMLLQALAYSSEKTKFSMVRFGNVLNSSGSVVPKFRQQVQQGGPVTVTDFRMTRYFMTIPEAAQLVIQAGALAMGGDVFLLDMGEPVKIIELARRMIELSGLEVRDEENPEGDIEIKEVGLRAGEKLYEELLIDGKPEKTHHPRIFKSHESFLSLEELSGSLAILNGAIASNDEKTLLNLLRDIVPGYNSKVDD